MASWKERQWQVQHWQVATASESDGPGPGRLLVQPPVCELLVRLVTRPTVAHTGGYLPFKSKRRRLWHGSLLHVLAGGPGPFNELPGDAAP